MRKIILLTAMIIAIQGYCQTDPKSIKKENPKANHQDDIHKVTRTNIDEIARCF